MKENHLTLGQNTGTGMIQQLVTAQLKPSKRNGYFQSHEKKWILLNLTLPDIFISMNSNPHQKEAACSNHHLKK